MGVSSQATPAQQQAAEKFFDYFYSKDTAAKWSLGSGWPPLTTTVDPSSVSSNPTVAALTAIAGSARPLLPGVVKSADVLTAVDSATQHALAGESASAALNAAQPSVQSALSGH
jgi:multiple sugar transport system substrate-binding protein